MNQTSSYRQLADSSGSALIITLLLITILTGLVTNFVYEVYIDTSSLSNWGNAQKASLIAKSGQVISSEFIRDINTYPYTDMREIMLPVERDFGKGTALTVHISDENAKFNINNIILSSPDYLSLLQKMFEYLNINPDLALAVADWIDPDSEPRLTGSEDNVKNAYLWSVEELKLIKGMDRDTFNKIRPYVTAYQPFGWEININTAELPVLISLHSDMTEILAQRIIDYREETPFEDEALVQNIPGMSSIGQQITTITRTRSSHFRIVSTATVNGITRIVESLVDNSLNVYFWREG